jgi:hypothetical protein
MKDQLSLQCRVRGLDARILCKVVILTTILSLIPPSQSAFSARPNGGTGLQHASFTLDNVSILLSTPSLPSPIFTTSDAGEVSQVATSVRWEPLSEFSVTAIPFNTKPGTEAVPIAQPGGADAYSKALRDYEAKQGATFETGPTATIFGTSVVAQVSHLQVKYTPNPVMAVEWVVEAGQRLWIIRVVQEQPFITADETSTSMFLSSLESMTMSSTTLNAPTTVVGAARQGSRQPTSKETGSASPLDPLPTPSWWSGQCDSGNFPGSYPLGGSYLGMPACGPLNTMRPVTFPGGHGEYEWQCTELSKRYLYLAYGILAYGADGREVVSNYHGTIMQHFHNSVQGAAPHEGDVLSYGTTGAGHTSVVTLSSVNSSGNGYVDVVEQNLSELGIKRLNVVNWNVQASPNAVTGWLHRGPVGEVRGRVVYANGTGAANVPVTSSSNGDSTYTDSAGYYQFELEQNINRNLPAGPTRLTASDNITSSYQDVTVIANANIYAPNIVLPLQCGGSGDSLVDCPTPVPTRTPDPGGAFTLSSPSYDVQPNQSVQVSIHLHSNTATFSPSNSILSSLDSQRYGAWEFQPLEVPVGPGGGFDFDRPDLFTMISPSSPGVYQVRWQMRVGGNLTGPISVVTLNVGQGQPTPTPVPAGTWHVQGYSNESLSGSPCYDANELLGSYVFKDWGWDGGPGGSCESDHFSVRFEQTATYFPEGNYSLHCEHDDGCRVYVDNELKIEAWGEPGGHDNNIHLSAGNHVFKVEYREGTGLARIEAWWRGLGGLPENQSVGADEWEVSYYGIPNIWQTPALILNGGSGIISYNWGNSGPGYGLPRENFSVRFLRTTTLACGQYQFNVQSDDGAILRVNNVPIIDHWGSGGSWSATADIPGGATNLWLEYQQTLGAASIHMDWQQLTACAPTPEPSNNDASFISQSVPQTTLFTGQTLDVAVIMRNDGNTTWTNEGSYRLGAQNPPDNNTWGLFRVALPNAVAPGDNGAFYFTIQAPQTPGTYDFQWQMVKDSNTWFGATTTNIVIDVVAPSGTPTGTPAPLQFTDVPPGSTFYDYIMCLALRNIISGYADGTFRPGNDISRGQIAKIVSNAAGYDEDPGPQIYEDVDSDNPFFAWINRLSMRRHMGGYQCGLVPEEPCSPPDNRPYFRPFANATRGQMSKIVANAADLGGTPAGLFYADVAEDHPFYLWIMRLTELGVMSGYLCGGDGEPCDDANRPYFRPFANVTRGQASKIVANTFFPNCQTQVRQ